MSGGKRVNTQEDYLRVIYELEDTSGARSIDVAKSLNISKASVSEMLRKLADKKLIKMEAYSNIFLTDSGWDKARENVKRHQTIKKFMEKLGHKDPKKEAENIINSISPETVEIIDHFIEGKVKIQDDLPRYIS
jgi:Mn-dependent DtxR family transcriptional regulator